MALAVAWVSESHCGSGSGFGSGVWAVREDGVRQAGRLAGLTNRIASIMLAVGGAAGRVM